MRVVDYAQPVGRRPHKSMKLLVGLGLAIAACRVLALVEAYGGRSCAVGDLPVTLLFKNASSPVKSVSFKLFSLPGLTPVQIEEILSGAPLTVAESLASDRVQLKVPFSDNTYGFGHRRLNFPYHDARLVIELSDGTTLIRTIKLPIVPSTGTLIIVDLAPPSTQSTVAPTG